MAERGTLSIPEAAWREAQRRAAVIGPLAAREAVSAAAARDAGQALGLSERTVYALLRRWRQSGGLAASLAPRPSPGGRGKGRIPDAAERVVAEAICDEYLTKQKKRAEAVVRAVRDRCRLVGTKPPAANTVRARVRRVRADLAARAREGANSASARRLTPAAGQTPPAGRAMAVLQIDHTPVDLVLVDETWRKPVGRPWLTLAIDVHSRCIAGLHLSFEAPSATVVGLCLAHAALDKAAYLRAIGVEADWPCQGRPGEVFVDNGPEFHSDAFKRGCGQHGITLRHRPPGAPHWGGIIERVIGTAMAMVHELPGTTFSNPAERGEYDSDKAACLALAELERWLVLAVTGPYHNAVHGGVGEPPLARWRAGVAEHGLPSAVADGRAFLVDFLPVLRRRVTREGIVCDHIAYYNAALRPLVTRRDQLGPVLVRRDPRDLSRVWVLDPDDGSYVEVPCSHQERPAISLHEHRLSVAHLRAQGRTQVDEDAIFRAVQQQREVVREAAQRTRSARKQTARTADAARGAPARTVPEPAASLADAADLLGNAEATYALDPYPVERW
ncbi:MAG: DDE-type integrase/transposase/recombinase [Acetobacteraceae bacterium]